MAELDFLKENNFSPIILLDDIYSELDDKRSQKLNEFIKNEKFIITSTNKNYTKNFQNINIINLDK